MKHIVLLGDGMADYPIPELGDKTPLSVANKPNINNLAKKGKMGLARTLFEGLPTGSDTANLSVLGYDPYVYYTGRSSIEALGLGIPMKDDDTIFRLNLVTLTGDGSFDDLIMQDHSAGKVTDDEASALIEAIKPIMENALRKLYVGVSYRHICIWNGIEYDEVVIPPHDILRKRMGDHLPKGRYSEELISLMKECYKLLSEHPINKERVKNGMNPANGIWLWGEAKKPKLSSFSERYGVKGAVVTAVPLIEGLAVGLGLDIIKVYGATGDYHTNYAGKAEAAVDAVLNDVDFVFIHVEAPDECGHDGDLKLKVASIERLDEMISYVKERMDNSGEAYKILFMPDHATPISLRTHTLDPIPFLIYDSRNEESGAAMYDELTAKQTGLFYEKGYELMKDFIEQ